MAYGAGTKTSSRHVENAIGHHQNATANNLGRHSTTQVGVLLLVPLLAV